MIFTDKVVIVTGASNGIGRAVASMYGGEGAKVIIADIDEENGVKVKESIEKNGGEARFCYTDVSNPQDIIKLVDYTIDTYGKIDILINNAGLSEWGSPYEISIDKWDRIINTNLRSVFLCSREAAKHMRKNGGAIINIASTRAFMSEANTEAYAATKGGIVAITHALAVSFSKDNITVNSISPGWIETGDYSKLREKDHKQHLSSRVGKPEDIARACLFLSNLENDFINGENLIIDGGMTRKMIYEH